MRKVFGSPVESKQGLESESRSFGVPLELPLDDALLEPECEKLDDPRVDGRPRDSGEEEGASVEVALELEPIPTLDPSPSLLNLVPSLDVETDIRGSNGLSKLGADGSNVSFCSPACPSSRAFLRLYLRIRPYATKPAAKKRAAAITPTITGIAMLTIREDGVEALFISSPATDTPGTPVPIETAVAITPKG